MTRFFGSNGGVGNGLAARLELVFRLAGLVGVAGLAVCVLGAIFDTQQVVRSYLMSYLFWLGIPFASTCLLLLNHLAGGTWGLIIRRPLEAGASTLLLMVPLFLPIAFGINSLYPWAGAEHRSVESQAEHHSPDDSAAVADDHGHEGDSHALASEGDHGHESHSTGYNHKEIWFGRPFFFGRAFGYFAIWGLFAFLLTRWSREQDLSASPMRPTRRLASIAAPGLILVFLSGTFAMFDWAMSLDPDWYSTIYGAMLIIGMGLQTFAFMNIVTTLLADRGVLEDLPQSKRFRDLGNLMLAFVMLWAYTSYSQFLIIWSGDLSEEIPWYLARSRNGWQYVVGFLAIFHFFFPFFVLLFRANKEKTSRLRAIASVIFLVHIVDVFWLLGPSLGYLKPIPHLLDLAALLGVGGLWVAAFSYFLNSRPLIARNAPALIELRAHGTPHVPQTES